jgi:nitrate/nitrite transporter NarK
VAKYIFITLEAIMAFTLIPTLWPERIRTSQGAAHAALAIGITSASSALHGIVGPQLYQKKFGPRYTISFGISIGLTLVAIISIAVTWAIMGYHTKTRQKHVATRRDRAVYHANRRPFRGKVMRLDH